MSDAICHLDFETRSDIDLTKCGVHVYCESPLTEILCVAWAFGNDAVESKRLLGSPECPPEIQAHAAADGRFGFHNASFELELFRMMNRRDKSWPLIRAEQVDDTMAMAARMAFPLALGKAAEVLGLDQQKSKAGRAIMLKMCKPRKPGKDEQPGALLWHETGEQLDELEEYCRQDVRTERDVFDALPPLTDYDRKRWLLDRRINERGVAVDVESVNHMLRQAALVNGDLTLALHHVTQNRVRTAKSVAAMKSWLLDQGVELANLQAATVVEALASHLPGIARRALEIRSQPSKSSTDKLAAMTRGTNRDGRSRELHVFHGATTGRAAGRRIQPQNMKRPPKGFKRSCAEDVIFMSFAPDARPYLCPQYGGTMSALANSVRALLVSGRGTRLIVADYANIEGRVLAWLAGEQWKLGAFRETDSDDALPDMYKRAYGRTFDVDPATVDSDQRQIGKVQELALGYQGSHGAFMSMASGYALDLDAVALAVHGATDGDTWIRAIDRFESWPGDKFGLDRQTWIALRVVVDGWRAAHPATVRFWRSLEGAALSAVRNPGQIHFVDKIAYRMQGPHLKCRLPSGRCLNYPFARVVQAEQWGRVVDKLAYDSVSSKKGSNKKWMEHYAYGGLLAENVTQAVACDILFEAIQRLEDAGYPTVLHIHDEDVSELPFGVGSLEEKCEIMCRQLSWAQGLPLAAAGWEGPRFWK